MSVIAPDVVLICGRSFELGAAYRPGRRPDGAPRRLLAHDPRYPWPGGRVELVRVEGRGGTGERRMDMSGRAWVAWTTAARAVRCTPSHFVPVEHGDRRYASVAEAARSAGVTPQSMWYRLRDPLSGWRRLRP